MEYRKLPRGSEQFSVIGLGTGSLHEGSKREIEQAIGYAIERGVNFFDLSASAYKPFHAYANALRGKREKAYLQMHFGAIYVDGKYGWSRDLAAIKGAFQDQLKLLGTDYTDMGYLHCVDDHDDYDFLEANGVFDYILGLKRDGVIRHVGFSSHSVDIARRFLETGLVDMFMFSINPAYDFAEENGAARAALYRDCAASGVGISVMKAFGGGQLLNAKASPFRHALTKYQLIRYALDRPGVLTCLPGIRGTKDLEEVLGYFDAQPEETDYSEIGSLAPYGTDRCVYCNHCQPCPVGIDIGLINKYYDLSTAGDLMARDHYGKLRVKADACKKCGHCESRCPFHVKQEARMREIAWHFQDLA